MDEIPVQGDIETKPQPATGALYIEPELQEGLSQNPLDVIEGDGIVS